MKAATFNKIRSFVYDKSGISLSEGKETLVSARLGKRMRKLNIQDHSDYLQYVIDHEDEGELTLLLDAICTNFTSFFRESDHFDFLKDTMTEHINNGQTRFRIWSAASSTGEEPYSIGVTLLQAAGGHTLDMRILATDLSTKVLSVARQGLYDHDRIQSMPAQLRERYFTRETQDGERFYRASETLRKLIAYRRLNLSNPPFPMQGPLDIVFCRNVMIYFDNHVRKRLINEIHRLLRPGGHLLVGHSESLTGITEGFQSLRPSIYQKVG